MKELSLIKGRRMRLSAKTMANDIVKIVKENMNDDLKINTAGVVKSIEYFQGIPMHMRLEVHELVSKELAAMGEIDVS